MTKLEQILANVQDTKDFRNAVDCISQEFHNYQGEEDIPFEEDTLENFCYDNSDAFTTFSWASGASKVCIICDSHDGNDYVLKTAYCGYAYEPEDDEGEPIPGADWEFEDYHGADECRVEYLVYRAAVAAGLGHFFAETIKLDIGIYMQEKYDCPVDGADVMFRIGYTLLDRVYDEDYPMMFNRDKVSKLVQESGLNDFYRHLRGNAKSFMLFYDRYGLQELLRLQAFLEEYDINDLHASNIGIFGNDVKFVDYCGYGSTTSIQVGAA